jgi:pyruvate formate lyase activating enzyme
VTTGIVFDIKRFAVHDGPGIRTTVFLKGCPLRCQWCHNPEGQSMEPELVLRESLCMGCGACVPVCPQGAISMKDDHAVTDREKCLACGACVEVCYTGARELAGQEMAPHEVMAVLERDIPFYEESGGGVTFSGGEPLSQDDFLHALLSACKDRGIHAAVDTCGFCSWKHLDALRHQVKLFLYDLKMMDDVRHRELTGVSNAPVIENLRALSQEGHMIILRVPVIPGVNDDAETVRQIGRFVSTLPSLYRVDLLPYHNTAAEKYRRLNRTYHLTEVLPPSSERMHEVALGMQECGFAVKIGG